MSPNTDDEQRGIALYCDREGYITEWIKDQLEISFRSSDSPTFFDLIESSDENKARRFMGKIRDDRAALDWEMNVRLKEQVRPIHFSGGLNKDHILIVGSTSHENTISYMEELAKLNNEQINSLRQHIKSKFTRKQHENEKFYDELTALNNELANARRKIEKKNAELERLNRVKDEFMGMAAHDLRNPLSVILSFSDLLLEDNENPLTEEQREMVEKMYESSQYMRQLIDELLEVNKLESGKMQLSLERVDLQKLVRKSISMNEQIASQKQINIQFRVGGDLPSVESDPQKIEQVMNNLISNAIKYSHPDSQISIGLKKRDGNVEISVADEGQGIPEEEQDKIFESFAKTSVETTQGEESTGLGLSITKKIVEGHNGSIRVESESGVGTTFYVTLPISQE